jgi:hypothetical protein
MSFLLLSTGTSVSMYGSFFSTTLGDIYFFSSSVTG